MSDASLHCPPRRAGTRFLDRIYFPFRDSRPGFGATPLPFVRSLLSQACALLHVARWRDWGKTPGPNNPPTR